MLPLPLNLLGILFALTSAAIWGGGDFTGGVATRHDSPFRVLTLSAFSGLALLAVAALVLGEAFPSPTGITWAMLAGIAGSFGIAALYRALAIGQAALVSPMAAVVGAVLPVLYGAIANGLPAPLKQAGFALALVGIWLVAAVPNGELSDNLTQPGEAPSARALPEKPSPEMGPWSSIPPGLVLAVLAGIGFGAFFIFIGQVERGKILTPLIVARSFTLLTGLALVGVNRLRLPALRSNPLALLAGLLGAGGDLFYILARQYTRLDVAAVLASIYPASTVLLAALIMKEKVSPRQGLGVLVCLAAIALISV